MQRISAYASYQEIVQTTEIIKLLLKQNCQHFKQAQYLRSKSSTEHIIWEIEANCMQNNINYGKKKIANNTKSIHNSEGETIKILKSPFVYVF